MILSLVFATAVSMGEIRILFLGNSHTTNHNVPSLVQSILESSEPKPTVTIRTQVAGFLDGFVDRKDVLNLIRSGKWTHVILQGQKLSSSHRYEYSKDAGIFLSKLSSQSNAKVLLFAEWSRKGIDESSFQINGYRPIAKASGAKIVPTCNAFDLALGVNKSLSLWAPDGNHSSNLGAYLAACTLANGIIPLNVKPTFVPRGIDAKTALLLWNAARSVHPIK